MVTILFRQFPNSINNGSVNPFNNGNRLIGKFWLGWFATNSFSLGL
jgi:hypothetical protein